MGFLPMVDICIERAGYFIRGCEDWLVLRQREARYGRSGYDVQRRICWYDQKQNQLTLNALYF